MVGRYDSERDWREREARQRNDDRYDVFGANEDRGSRGREDRVFGERESGVGYNRPQPGGRPDYRAQSGGGGRGWQDPNYGGVSPAMQRGDYDTGYRSNPRFSGSGQTSADRDGSRPDGAPGDAVCADTTVTFEYS